MAKKAERAKRSVPSETILKDYKTGASLAELREKYGIRGKSHLASAVLDALISTGKMPTISRRRSKVKAVPQEFTVTVTKRGTIILPKEAVIMAFQSQEGAVYQVRKRGKRIILTQSS